MKKIHEHDVNQNRYNLKKQNIENIIFVVFSMDNAAIEEKLRLKIFFLFYNQI